MESDLAKQCVHLLGEIAKIEDRPHRRMLLIGVIIGARSLLQSEDGSDLDTLHEVARMALWQVVHCSHASMADRNATLRSIEERIHGLVAELDYHEPVGPAVVTEH